MIETSVVGNTTNTTKTVAGESPGVGWVGWHSVSVAFRKLQAKLKLFRGQTILYFGNRGVAVSSDKRLKSDIKPLSHGLESILKIVPKEYIKHKSTSQNDLGNKEYGFIAQEIQNTFPSLVQPTTSPEKLLALSYTELIPVITKAIQEQQELIKALQKNLEIVTKELIELKAVQSN